MMACEICEASPKNFARAGEIIRAGGLVAFPTETVYGLGADALSPEAIRGIFDAKGRPQDNPLIVHIADMPDLDRVAVMTEHAYELALMLWPGPLTMVLEAREVVPPETRAGLPTVAVRMPSNDVALALIRAAGTPIAAPSANRSGRPSPTDAATVARDLGDAVDMILDGGAATLGVESTVVDLTGGMAVVLRDGGLSREALARYVELDDPPDAERARRSPGTRHRHYAPKAPVVILGDDHADLASARWGYIGIGEPPRDTSAPARSVVFQNVDEMAHGLYAALRDMEDLDLIAASLPPADGIGMAVRDRLLRAAGKK